MFRVMIIIDNPDSLNNPGERERVRERVRERKKKEKPNLGARATGDRVLTIALTNS